MTFVFILFIVFVVIPVVRILWRGYKLHRQWTEATRGMRDAFAGAQQRRQGPPEPPVKKKKIDPNVGEYIRFEEVSTSTQATSADCTTRTSSTTIHYESQVEDAQWEDIK